MTGAVPPSSFKPPSTILAPSVVISVNCAELRPFLRQTFAKLSIDVSIDDPELVKFSSDDEIIHSNLGCVPVPVFQLYQQLLRLGESYVVPVLKSYPVILFWVSKSVLIFVPAFQEVIGVLAKVSPPLQDSPASTQGLHVAPDCDLLPGNEDRVDPTRGDGLLLHQI